MANHLLVSHFLDVAMLRHHHQVLLFLARDGRLILDLPP